MNNSKIYMMIDDSWKEVGTCTNLEIDSETKDELKDFSKSLSGFGNACIELNNSLGLTNTAKLNTELRKKPKPESWKGDGKRKMRVVK